MASNFDMKKDELKPDKIYKVNSDSMAILLRGKHLFLAYNEKALAHIPESKPVTGQLRLNRRPS